MGCNWGEERRFGGEEGKGRKGRRMERRKDGGGRSGKEEGGVKGWEEGAKGEGGRGEKWNE